LSQSTTLSDGDVAELRETVRLMPGHSAALEGSGSTTPVVASGEPAARHEQPAAAAASEAVIAVAPPTASLSESVQTHTHISAELASRKRALTDVTNIATHPKKRKLAFKDRKALNLIRKFNLFDKSDLKLNINP
jgi:hypothetical protein